MSITDELRKFANDWDWLDYKAYESEQKLWAIADRIDAEYQKVLDKSDSERFNALMDARDDGVNAVLKEPEGFGLIALPKDADDKYIHIGDVMESKGSKLLFDEAPFEVWAMQYDDIGWEIYDHSGNHYAPSLLRHYHAQTVEDAQAENLVQVVRCRDCEYFVTNIHGNYCKKSISTASDSNGFCAWGKRREDV